MFRSAITALFHLCFCLSLPQNAPSQTFALDPNFAPTLSGSLGDQLIAILDMAVQTNGQVIVVGSFTNINGQTRNGVARLKPDGSLDDTFDPGVGPNGTVWSVAIDSSGRILIGGEFSTWNDTSSGPLVRLLTNGEIDPEFPINNFSTAVPTAPTMILDLHIDLSQYIFAGGSFTHYAGVAHPFLVRLDPQGALDENFPAGPENIVVAIRDSGRAPSGIMVAGGFDEVANLARPAVAALYANGLLDGSFSPSLNPDNLAWDVVTAPHGNVYVGGDFNPPVRRFHSSGAADENFNPAFTVNPDYLIATLLPFGESIFVGGYFEGVGGSTPSSLALLNSDGSLNRAFGSTGANDLVNKLLFDRAGNLLVAGAFTTLEGQRRTGLARYLKSSPELRLLSPTLLDGQIRFTFLTEVNDAYELQSTTNPAGDWTNLDTIAGTGAEFVVNRPATDPQSFFRIRRN